jgi:hypothetical protein
VRRVEIVPDVRQRTGRALDERGVCGSPAERLDAHAARAREQVEE